MCKRKKKAAREETKGKKTISVLFFTSSHFIPAAHATTPSSPPPSTASGTGTFKTSVTAKTTIPIATVASGKGLCCLKEIASESAAGALVIVLWAAVLIATLVAASKVPHFPAPKSSLGLNLWAAMFRAVAA